MPYRSAEKLLACGTAETTDLKLGKRIAAVLRRRDMGVNASFITPISVRPPEDKDVINTMVHTTPALCLLLHHWYVL